MLAETINMKQLTQAQLRDLFHVTVDAYEELRSLRAKDTLVTYDPTIRTRLLVAREILRPYVEPQKEGYER